MVCDSIHMVWCMIPYVWCDGSAAAALGRANIQHTENMNVPWGSHGTLLSSNGVVPKFCTAAVAALRKKNQALVFSMSLIILVTAAAPSAATCH